MDFKDYLLVIRDNEGLHYFHCDDMKEVENCLFTSGKIIDFEIFKQVNNESCLELLELVFKRFRKICNK